MRLVCTSEKRWAADKALGFYGAPPESLWSWEGWGEDRLVYLVRPVEGGGFSVAGYTRMELEGLADES